MDTSTQLLAATKVFVIVKKKQQTWSKRERGLYASILQRNTFRSIRKTCIELIDVLQKRKIDATETSENLLPLKKKIRFYISSSEQSQMSVQ
jgi:hypothetical protein